jgi:two-component system, OmpR family, heavy metal sensor histidine kinase CusS
VKLNNTSISRRLFIGTILAFAITTIAGSFFINHVQRVALTNQLDNQLRDSAALQTIEIEIEDEKPVQEWLGHIEENPLRAERDLIQVWDLHHQQTYRSPALGENNLPMLHAALDEYVIQNITLPNGKSARALGVKILPAYDESEPLIDAENYSHLEHVFVIALETTELEETLTRLRNTMVLVTFATLLLCIITIAYTIKRSLIPLAILEEKIQTRETRQLGAAITISEDFPSELRGLVTEYNALLKRIEGVRIRERDFSTHAAHELRTPLAGIQATLEQAIAIPREPLGYIQRIEKSLAITKSMKGLISSLMQFSRLQSENISLHLERLNFHHLLEATWESYSEIAAENGVKALQNLSSDQSTRMGDEKIIQILFSNLIGNAVAYSAAGSLITIATADRANALELVITNQTQSPLPVDLDHLFEPFVRLQRSSGTGNGHSGIGLSLCREIAINLNAEISLHSPQPTTFEVRITFP